jgi:hypothetical protein
MVSSRKGLKARMPRICNLSIDAISAITASLNHCLTTSLPHYLTTGLLDYSTASLFYNCRKDVMNNKVTHFFAKLWTQHHSLTYSLTHSGSTLYFLFLLLVGVCQKGGQVFEF